MTIISLLSKEFKEAIAQRVHKSMTKLVAMKFVIKFKNILKMYGSNLDIVNLSRIRGTLKFHYYSIHEVKIEKSKKILEMFFLRSIVFMAKL